MVWITPLSKSNCEGEGEEVVAMTKQEPLVGEEGTGRKRRKGIGNGRRGFVFRLLFLH